MQFSEDGKVLLRYFHFCFRTFQDNFFQTWDQQQWVLSSAQRQMPLRRPSFFARSWQILGTQEVVTPAISHCLEKISPGQAVLFFVLSQRLPILDLKILQGLSFLQHLFFLCVSYDWFDWFSQAKAFASDGRISHSEAKEKHLWCIIKREMVGLFEGPSIKEFPQCLLIHVDPLILIYGLQLMNLLLQELWADGHLSTAELEVLRRPQSFVQ